MIDRDWVMSAVQRFLPGFDRVLMRSNAIAEHEVFPNGLFGWAAALEASWETIRDEAAALLRDRRSVPSIREISPDHAKIALDDKWRSFFLWAYGKRADLNCARCPETARIVEKVPGMLSAFFSVMLAGAHVPRHTGPTKAILTVHLGLIIPIKREDCHMAVGNENVVWEPGRLVVFDDMQPHEVWNDTDEDRIILLLHVKRPLRFPGSWLREMFFAGIRRSPIVRDGMRNMERFEKDRRETPTRSGA